MYEYTLDSEVTISVFNSMSKLLKKCNYSLNYVKLNENLSINALEELNGTELNLIHIDHTMRLIRYMISSSAAPHAITYDEFNADQLLSEICKSFSPLSKVLPINISMGKNRLKLNSLIMNQTNFEFIVYNFIYCGIAAYPNNDSTQFNIALSITETENSNVLHIRSNRRILSSEIIDILNAKNRGIKLTKKIVNDPADLSFAVLFKALNAANTECRYKQLKSGCHIDVSFPKYLDKTSGMFKSGDYYFSDISLALGTFSDLLISNHKKTGQMPRTVEF